MGGVKSGGGRRVAFLRGINVGGHRVAMADLRASLEALGLDDVATFIASGNVIFRAPGQAEGELETAIEGHLEETLGFDVPTFVRDLDVLREIASLELPPPDAPEGFKVHVTFLKEAAGPQVASALRALECEDDRFRVRGREVFWLRRGGITDSAIRPGELDAAMGRKVGTMRTLNTVRRIVKKFGD